MVRTKNTITIPDLERETAKMYVKVNFITFVNEGASLQVSGEYFYYPDDNVNNDPVIISVINKAYVPAQYNALYSAITIESENKSDKIKEEINKILPYEIINTYPNLGLNVDDFEVV